MNPPNSPLSLPPPPFKIKVVEPIKITTQEERKGWLEKAGYNIFNIPAEEVYIDLLTDSGTSAMSDHQWAGLMIGDESYAQCKNFFHLEKVVQGITGYRYVIPTHQGRSAEHLLCHALGIGESTIAVSNQFFDTTRANIETAGGDALDLVISEAYQPDKIVDFKGNIDTAALRRAITERGNIALIVLTITNNAGGGQPVSIANMAETAKIAKEYEIPYFLDAARFAENAYFIKLREPGYQDKPPRDIARKMFGLADGCVMSAKKDGLINIGGLIALNDEHLYRRLTERMVVVEGFPTYGGLAGRDLEAMARGLTEVLHEEYLQYRFQQLNYLHTGLTNAGVPVLKPVGGHGCYLDAQKFLPHVPQSQFPGWAITVALYEQFGIRCVEIGSVMSMKQQPDGTWVYPPLDFVRLAIPRRVYSQEHLNYTIEAVGTLYQHRDEIRGLRITYDPGVLRHFTARFEPL